MGDMHARLQLQIEELKQLQRSLAPSNDKDS